MNAAGGAQASILQSWSGGQGTAVIPRGMGLPSLGWRRRKSHVALHATAEQKVVPSDEPQVQGIARNLLRFVSCTCMAWDVVSFPIHHIFHPWPALACMGNLATAAHVYMCFKQCSR
jgi:hypothetical protein